MKKRGGKIVNFKLTEDQLRIQQLAKDLVAKEVAPTVVVIDEVDTDNWGIGGESVTVRRQRGS